MGQRELRTKIYWTSLGLAICLLVFLVSVVFLNPTSAGNPSFPWKINLWAIIWAVNFIIVLVLGFILARNLIKLCFDYRTNRPGSRLKTKLVFTLSIFSLFPALLMAFLAFGLINRNLQHWFSSPSEQVLSSSQQIATSYYEQRKTLSFVAASWLAERLRQGALDSENLEDWSRRLGFQSVGVLAGGELAYTRSHGPPQHWEEKSIASALEAIKEGRHHYVVDARINTPRGIVDRGLVAVPAGSGEEAGQQGILAFFEIPHSVAFHAVQVADAAKNYNAIKGGVTQLEVNYVSILLLTTLAVVFGFVWLGNYIANRITVPLEALAQGARALKEGDLDHRVSVRADDELGILVDSFNGMAEEIKHNRMKLEMANRELRTTNVRLDERRRYIETILQNIATGVISLNESGLVQTVNEATLRMLRTTSEQVIQRPMQQLLGQDLSEEFKKMVRRAQLYGTCRKEVTFDRGEHQLHVAVTITYNPLPDKNRADYLIVLDDLTELIKAEKFAAWQEVARRLAHEIKNPLTPIQLSAERIEKRVKRLVRAAPHRPDLSEVGEIVKDAVRIIQAEATILKSLVEEFSRFARMPICKPTEVELHALIENTLSRYDGTLGQVEIRRDFDRRIDRVRVDPAQMQRVFVNLIDNSLDALARSDGAQQICVSTSFDEKRESVRIQFQDSGIGIPPEDYDNLFLPYFSTKKKGTGLGLAIVRQIISEHNGFIRAEANAPQGTRFVMELPLTEGDPTPS